MAAGGPQRLDISNIYRMFATSVELRKTSFRKYLKFITDLDDVYITNYLEKQ